MKTRRNSKHIDLNVFLLNGGHSKPKISEVARHLAGCGCLATKEDEMSLDYNQELKQLLDIQKNSRKKIYPIESCVYHMFLGIHVGFNN